MIVQPSTKRQEWEDFLKAQRFSPFLQSWTMGDVFQEIGQDPIRLEVREGNEIIAICQAIVVPAKRGRHLMVQYGPIVSHRLPATGYQLLWNELVKALSDIAVEHRCSFLRISPFTPFIPFSPFTPDVKKSLPSPLHLLSEYTWYIPLRTVDRWQDDVFDRNSEARSDDEIKMDMRKTTRNLIGRAEREGVTVTASKNPNSDLDIYFKLQEETYKRHHFVPYRESFIRAQVKHFAPQNQAIVYIAKYLDEPIAASVHMTYGGVTSYHHGASTHKYAKIPASYLLQWTAIHEALQRGDSIYNFWGIAPRKIHDNGEEIIINKNHPFAGVTTFKTGFGGKPFPLVHCFDIPLSNTYYLTRAFEQVRKWRRGF